MSSTRKDFTWTNSHHIAGDLRSAVQKLKDATPAGVLLGSGKLATELDRLDQIDETSSSEQPNRARYHAARISQLRKSSRTPRGTN